MASDRLGRRNDIMTPRKSLDPAMDDQTVVVLSLDNYLATYDTPLAITFFCFLSDNCCLHLFIYNH